MRRGTILGLVTVVFLAIGLFNVLGNAQRVIALSPEYDDLILGIGLLMVGSVAGLFSVALFRSECRSLASRLNSFCQQGKLGALEAGDTALLPLVQSLNEVVEFAERAVSDAQLQLRELQIQLKVATAQRQHAETILFSINDAVLVTDSFDQIVLGNDSAARTFGFELSKAQRQPIEKIVKEAKVVEMIREMRQSDTRSGRRILEHQFVAEGQTRAFKITLSCVRDREDHNAGVVAVLHDVTKEKEVAEMKNDFVSNVSHELRTPLASIKAYVEMLIDGEADDEKTKREFYDVIQNEANRLSRLIDNILNVSRIESGLVKVNKQPMSVMMVVKEAIEVIIPQARTKNIKISEDLSPVGYQTQADRDMLYQAILNLLSNSVKYTPENGTVSVQTEIDEQRKKILIRISDNGVGIPPKDLPFVFDKFYRVEANNKMAKGTGLGLPLVKHIIETVHKGRIFVESTVGKGSSFGIELAICD